MLTRWYDAASVCSEELHSSREYRSVPCRIRRLSLLHSLLCGSKPTLYFLVLTASLAALPRFATASYRHGEETSPVDRQSDNCEPACARGGTCLNGTCVCPAGWAGTACEHCSGRIQLTEKQGRVETGKVNPETSAFSTVPIACSWIIDVSQSFPSVRKPYLHFTVEAAPNCSSPSVFLFQGDDVYTRLVASLGCGELTRVTVSGPRAIIVFQEQFADVIRYRLDFASWNISYQVDSCAGGCWNGGVCYDNGSTPVCKCPPGFVGSACLIPACREGSCIHGVCDIDTQLCICPEGYQGADCSLAPSAAFWLPAHVKGDHVPGPRASHSALVVKGGIDYLYVFGGYGFEPIANGSIEQLSSDSFVHRFSLSRQSWTPIPDTDNGPSGLYDHAVVQSGSRIYLFGGRSIADGSLLNDMWAYTADENRWDLVAPGDPDNYRQPPYAVAGHTMHTYRNELLVFFGYSRTRGYLNIIQRYSRTNGSWSVFPVRGAVPSERYGHSSVTYNGRIFVYGGFTAAFGGGSQEVRGVVSNELYVFDLANATWSFLGYGRSPIFLHSAAVLNGLMVVFGGRRWNASEPSATCFSREFWAYDMDCDEVIDLRFPTYLEREGVAVVRYGHSAVGTLGDGHRSRMYVFGGYNGNVLNDMLIFTPGTCQNYSKETCESEPRSEANKCVFHPEGCFSVSSPQDVAQSKNGKIPNKRQNDEPDVRLSQRVHDVVPPERTAGLPKCPERPAADFAVREANCRKIQECSACSFSSPKMGCQWCHDRCTFGGCHAGMTYFDRVKDVASLESVCDSHSQAALCERKTNCFSCYESPDCFFVERSAIKDGSRNLVARRGDCSRRASKEVDSEPRKCPIPCANLTTCGDCFRRGVDCAWCGSTGRCLSTNGVGSQLEPYGICPKLIETWFRCPEEGTQCSGHKSCDTCLSAGANCGWCSDGSGKGSGACQTGGMTGPLGDNVTCPMSNTTGGFSATTHWYFLSCPACQCNGHAKCQSPNETVLPADSAPSTSLGSMFAPTESCLSCEDSTSGSRCQYCANHFYGDARNAGKCEPCECNGQADTCDPTSGRCYCRTKGVMGDHCDRCDPTGAYVSINKTCFYNLTVDYVFTFPMTLPDDKNHTQYKFFASPTSAADLTFTLSCSYSDAVRQPRFNFSITSNAPHKAYRTIMVQNICHNQQKIERRFDKEEYKIGQEYNTTFWVTLFEIEAPVQFKISFAQTQDIWLKFFITFASCFVSLLVAGALAWKLKMRFDVYRRRQRMFVEMAAMASRPFGCAQLDLTRSPDPLRGSPLRNMSPVCIEPCADHRAAIATIAIRLPTGGAKYTPSGQTGLAVGSTIVTLSPGQAVHLQASPESPELYKRKVWRPKCIT